jgi:hypothetical protein
VGLTKTDEEWSTALDAETAIRRDDRKHGTTPAYVSAENAGSICSSGWVGTTDSMANRYRGLRR